MDGIKGRRDHGREAKHSTPRSRWLKGLSSTAVISPARLDPIAWKSCSNPVILIHEKKISAMKDLLPL
jgi:hypothetical protein